MHANMDPYKRMQIELNEDGSLTRHSFYPNISYTTTPKTASSVSNTTVVYKDVLLNPTENTFIRIYRPISDHEKHPLLLYFHGGGFVVSSTMSEDVHKSCVAMSAALQCIILSVEYRLAPEHRLPAAYDDAMEAILWLRDQARDVHDCCDAWLKIYADFSNVFMSGISAGGNLTYHAALRALDTDMYPVHIKGLIINQPFFGGVRRSESELRMADDKVIPLPVTDLMWSLALPIGADRDHEYSNPTVAGEFDEKIGRLQRCLIRGYGGDPLIDRQREFAKMLGSRGVPVVAKFEDEGYHGEDIYNPIKALNLDKDMKEFMHSYNGDKEFEFEDVCLLKSRKLDKLISCLVSIILCLGR